MIAARTILHVDMDAFFAAIEQLDRPEWRGKPLLVGHEGLRGVVAAASYEARVYGCRSAQPMAVAQRLCPHAIVTPVRFDRYRHFSKQVFAIFESFTPILEPLSIDEAFMDCTGSVPLFGPGEAIARQIRKRVRTETGLTASVGVAGNKFLAKLASDLHKPDGLTVIGPDDIDRILPPLSINCIWGIGPKTAERLEGLGIRTIGDLRRVSPEVLGRRIGDDADRYLRLAHGVDDRPVTPDREAKSIGQEQTFGINLTEPEAIRSVLLEQVEQVGTRLRRHGLKAGGLTVKIRYGDFKTITRAAVLTPPADTTSALWQTARMLFDRWAERDFSPVRLIGVAASRVTAGDGQLDLFIDPATEKNRKLDGVLDNINAKFGKSAIHRGRTGRNRDAE